MRCVSSLGVCTRSEEGSMAEPNPSDAAQGSSSTPPQPSPPEEAQPRSSERSCAFCSAPLLTERKEQRFCSGVGSSCRQRAGAFRQAMDRLVAMDEASFREEIRGVLRRRYGMQGKMRRWHLRFGEYQEKEESPAERGRRVAMQQLAATAFHRDAEGRWGFWPITASMVTARIWSARQLRVVARLLDRKNRKEARRAL